MRDKKIIFLLLTAVLVIGGSIFAWRKNVEKKATGEKTEAVRKVTARDEAEKIAKDFLLHQNFKNDYAPNPISVEVYPEFWNVWFSTTDQGKRPNRGLIQVNNQTGEAQWKDLQ